MATKPRLDRGRLAEQNRINRVEVASSIRRLPPVVTAIGLGTVIAVIYGAFLVTAAIIVGELVAHTPGFAKIIILLTLGLLIIGAAPSVANWTLTRVIEFLRGTE